MVWDFVIRDIDLLYCISDKIGVCRYGSDSNPASNAHL